MHRVEATWIPPDIEIAEFHSRSKRPKSSDNEPLPVFGSGNGLHWAYDFGPGIVLHFGFMKFLSVIFLLMFLCGLPLFVFSLLGTALPTQPGSLQIEKTTLGNLFTNQTTPDTHSSFVIKGRVLMQSSYLAWLLPALDIVAVLIYLIGVLWFKRKIDKTVEKVDRQTLSMQDYSLIVKGFPRNATQADILEALGCADVVHRCDLATHSFAFLSLSGERGMLEKQIEIVYGKINKLTTESAAAGRPEPFRMGSGGRLEATGGYGNVVRDLDRLEEQLANVKRRQQNKADNEVYAAFLVFERKDERNMVLRRSFRQRPMVHGSRLRVAEAPEPSNIAYENLEYSPTSRIMRRVLTNLISAVLVAISFAFIYYAKTWQQQQPALTQECSGGEAAVCPVIATSAATISASGAVVDYTSLMLTLSGSITASYSGNQTMLDLCSNCFCQEAAGSYSATVLANKGLRTFCSSVLSALSFKAALVGISIAAIVVVNFALKSVLMRVVRFERRHTHSDIQRSIATKVFVAQFVNTAFITLLVNAQIPAIRDYFKKVNSSFPVFDGKYTDLDNAWYANVGASVAVTMCINALMVCVPVLLHLPLQKLREWYGRRYALTQNELNDIYVGPVFELASRMGVLLNTLFACTLYSAPAPVFNLIAAGTFFLAYWVDKVALLRLYRAPPVFNEELAVFATSLMPYAIMLHLMIGLWAFSALMPRQALTQALQDKINQISSKSGIPLDARLANWTAFPMFLVLLVLLVLLVWFRLLKRLLSRLCCSQADPKIDDERNPPFSVAIQRANWKGPTTYDIREMPEYRRRFVDVAQRARKMSVVGNLEEKRRHSISMQGDSKIHLGETAPLIPRYQERQADSDSLAPSAATSHFHRRDRQQDYRHVPVGFHQTDPMQYQPQYSQPYPPGFIEQQAYRYVPPTQSQINMHQPSPHQETETALC